MSGAILISLVATSIALGQQVAQPVVKGAPGTPPNVSMSSRAQEILMVNDQLIISAKDVEGIAESAFRIDADGTITIPLVGKVHAEGLTVDQLEGELTAQLAVYVRAPQVSVKRLITRADTIVVAGAFKNPGVYPLSNVRTLLDVISAVGGLEPNVRTMKITRRIDRARNPLRGAVEDPEKGITVATIDLARIVEDGGFGSDILIEPQDVLLAKPTAAAIVTGEVLKPGSFDFAGRDSFGFTELISLAGGLGKDAAPQNSKILRSILNGTRRAEIDVDAKSMLDGRIADFPILPNDIVVVPRSHGKGHIIARTLMYAVPAAISAAILVAVR